MMMPEAPSLPHVVIIGGGFGGLRLAQDLRRDRFRITLLDRRNHHLFQPLLYQVATAALNPSDIASPIRRVLRKQRNVKVLLAEATSIDLDGHRVQVDGGSITYDRLVLATGATHSYFGHPEWEKFAPGLKTIDDALEIRRRVLYAFEAAERSDDPSARASWLTFVVVGGGPTGVEMAGAMSEIARQTLAHDFRRIDPTQARVLLVEGSNRILPPYDPELSTKAQQQLESLGVEVIPGKHVTGIDAEGVSIGEERIASRTVVWAAGVAASPLARSLGVPLDKPGRVLVTPELTVPGHPDVFVLGDLVHLEQDGHPIPGVAPAALQMADQTAINLRRSFKSQPLLPFHYRDKGSLATIGRAAAVADFGRVKLSGTLAWLAWLFIHIVFLIGFRNRFIVLFQWAWSYVTYDRGARLITGPPVESRPEPATSP